MPNAPISSALILGCASGAARRSSIDFAYHRLSCGSTVFISRRSAGRTDASVPDVRMAMLFCQKSACRHAMYTAGVASRIERRWTSPVTPTIVRHVVLSAPLQ